jgi:hypothetical protein
MVKRNCSNVLFTNSMMPLRRCVSTALPRRGARKEAEFASRCVVSNLTNFKRSSGAGETQFQNLPVSLSAMKNWRRG